MIHAPQLPGPGETRLHFVRDQENAILLRCCAHAGPEIIRRDNAACLTLNGFEQNTSNTDTDLIANFELFLHRVSIAIYSCWLIAFLSGAISGMLRMS